MLRHASCRRMVTSSSHIHMITGSVSFYVQYYAVSFTCSKLIYVLHHFVVVVIVLFVGLLFLFRFLDSQQTK